MILKSINRFLLYTKTGLVLPVFILLFSCSKDKLVNDKVEKVTAMSSAMESTSDYTDDQVFEAVMLFSGPASGPLYSFTDFDLLKTLKEKENDAAFVDFKKSVIERMHGEYPGYIQSFRQDVTSGDYYKVKTAVMDSRTKLTSIVQSVSGVSDPDMEFIKSAYDKSKVTNSLSEGNKPVSQVLDEISYDAAKGKNRDLNTIGPSDVAVALYFFLAIAIAWVLVIPFADNGAEDAEFLTEKYLTTVTTQFKDM